MKPLNTIELDGLIDSLSFMVGAEAQDIFGSEDVLTIKLWSGYLLGLTFSLKGNAPFFLSSKNKIELDPEHLKKPAKKPIFVFYKSHFKGKKLIRIERCVEYGRLLRFHFGENRFIELRLFPGGVNFGLVAEGKKVFVKKPLPLVEVSDDYTPDMVRSPAVIFEEALDFLKPSEKEMKAVPDSLEKKEKARTKILEGLDFLKKDKYKILAELLEKNLPLTEELKEVYKDKLSLRENIEWAYEQQKQKKLKIERLEERLKELDAFFKKQNSVNGGGASKSVDLKATRHLQVSETLRAFCGKTAQENLDLLRKAKSWHIWMHLKDYPSGHLILASPKNYVATEEELKKCALFLFKVAAPKKLHVAEEVSFEIIFTQTKFVKPIKGAKSGLAQPSRTESRVYLWKRSENLSF